MADVITHLYFLLLTPCLLRSMHSDMLTANSYLDPGMAFHPAAIGTQSMLENNSTAFSFKDCHLFPFDTYS